MLRSNRSASRRLHTWKRADGWCAHVLRWLGHAHSSLVPGHVLQAWTQQGKVRCRWTGTRVQVGHGLGWTNGTTSRACGSCCRGGTGRRTSGLLTRQSTDRSSLLDPRAPFGQNARCQCPPTPFTRNRSWTSNLDKDMSLDGQCRLDAILDFGLKQ